jgi:hypothetical protein
VTARAQRCTRPGIPIASVLSACANLERMFRPYPQGRWFSMLLGVVALIVFAVHPQPLLLLLGIALIALYFIPHTSGS